MGKFQVGDRVRVYSCGEHGVLIGTIGCFDDTTGRIRFDYCSGDKFFWVYPQQCRKLVKKARRRVFLTETEYFRIYGALRGAIEIGAEVLGRGELIEFVEVKKKPS